MITIALARILALYLVAIGIAFLLDPSRIKRLYPQMMRDENYLFLGGLIALLIGAVIVSIHNYWILDWPVIITILGWWSLIKGFGILISDRFVNLFSRFENKSDIFYRILGVIYTVVGLVLGYFGWIW